MGPLVKPDPPAAGSGSEDHCELDMAGISLNELHFRHVAGGSHVADHLGKQREVASAPSGNQPSDLRLLRESRLRLGFPYRPDGRGGGVKPAVDAVACRYPKLGDSWP